MSDQAEKKSSYRIVVTISIALIVFLIGYFGWAFYDVSNRYMDAVLQSELQAHTILGKEGYEYIFEPSTQVLIDKIMPNRGAILFYIFQKDYLPLQIGPECTYPDRDICNWIDIHIFYGHDPRPAIRKSILYATIMALLFALVLQAFRKAKSLQRQIRP